MSLYAVFRIEFHNDKQCYDLLGIFSEENLCHNYIKRRLKEKMPNGEKLDTGFKRCSVLTKEKYFTIVAKRGSFTTKCPGFCIEEIILDKHYK